MKPIDLFIRCTRLPDAEVMFQAATQLGREWLSVIDIGIRIGEAIIVSSYDDIERLFSMIPEEIQTLTM